MTAQANPDTLRRLYRSLRLTRDVEERVAQIYPTDKIKSPVHLSIGQEAVSVGVCDALRPEDLVSATYRGHAAYMAKGGNLPAMVAELYGKRTGCSGGKGGSMHLIDMEHNVLGTSSVVGTSVPMALGYALAARRRRTGQVVVAFLGDGATEEGCFAESLNFAALHRLPVLFVCENNGFAIHTPLSKRWATRQLCERVATYGIPTHRLVDGDVLAIRDVAHGAVEAIRSGASGPVFMECLTYRWREHVGPGEDYDQGYRHRDAMTPWQENDQVERLARLIGPAGREDIDASVRDEIDAAFAFAENSPFPPTEDLYAHVFAS